MIDALGEAASFDDNTYFIGAQFSIPLENRAARSQFSQAELQKAQALWAVKELESMIETDVKADLRSIALTQNNISHDIKIIEFEKKKLDGEEKKYRFGRSSSDIILRYEEDVINARIAHLRSIRDYAVSQVNLKRNQNVLLDSINWTTYEEVGESK
jgi:outer membrane protein TolC